MGLLQTHLLSSHSLLKGQTCSKSQTAPKAKFDLGRQKPLHSSQAALTKCNSFLSSASESPGTPRNTTEDELVPCSVLGCKFQCISRKVTGEIAALQVAHAGTLGTAQVCSQDGDLPEEQQADSGACPAHSSLLVPCLDVHPLCSGLLEGETLTVLTFPGSHFWDLGSACTWHSKPFPSLTLFSFPCSSAYVSPHQLPASLLS